MRHAGPTRKGVVAMPLAPSQSLVNDTHSRNAGGAGHSRRGAATPGSLSSHHRRGVCQHWNGSTCGLEKNGKSCPHRSTHWQAIRNTPPRQAIAKYMLRVQHELKPKHAANRQPAQRACKPLRYVSANPCAWSRMFPLCTIPGSAG